MAMTDAEKEAKILEIGELVSEISRTNQLLLDIFRASGVSNPDWSVMKAELQSWVQTQLNNYAKTSSLSSYTKLANSISTGNFVDIASLIDADSNLKYGAIRLYNSSTENRIQLLTYSKTGSLLGGVSVIAQSNNSVLVTTDGTLQTENIRCLNNPTIKKATPSIIISNSNYNKLKTNSIQDQFSFIRFCDTTEDLNAGVVASLRAGFSSSSSRKTCSLFIGANSPTNGTAVSLCQVYNSTDAANTFTYIEPLLKVKGAIVPNATNSYSLGSADLKWTTIYARDSAINTSDEREKEDISDIDEKLLQLCGKIKFKQFKFKDAIQKKGLNARLHFGVIAQHVKGLFDEASDDPEKYAWFCYDEWDAKETETGNIEAGNSFGIRYEELLCLMVESLRKKNESLEQRVRALENKE